jgi:predicted nucleic acid-binding protein
MSFVLDASVPLSWCFDEDQAKRTKGVLAALETQKAVVPGIWPLEVSNALVVGERRRRIDVASVEKLLAEIGELAIEIDVAGCFDAFSRVIPIARRYSLTTYDATYLELALRLGRPLATLDERLRDAAISAGIAMMIP